MTIFCYFIAYTAAALFITGAAFVVFRAGEKELICKYGQEDKKQ